MSSGRGRPRQRRIDGRTVRISGDDRAVRPFRGFFSGDEIGVAHHADTAAETTAARAARAGDAETAAQQPSGVVTISIGEVSFDFHRLPEGYLHSHQLPFMSFTTVDEAAQALVRLVQRSEKRDPGGRS